MNGDALQIREQSLTFVVHPSGPGTHVLACYGCGPRTARVRVPVSSLPPCLRPSRQTIVGPAPRQAVPSDGILEKTPSTSSALALSKVAFERPAFILLSFIVGWAFTWSNWPSLRADDGKAVAFFEKEVRPLLVERCQPCHNAEKSKNGLKLTDRRRS